MSLFLRALVIMVMGVAGVAAVPEREAGINLDRSLVHADAPAVALLCFGSSKVAFQKSNKRLS